MQSNLADGKELRRANAPKARQMLRKLIDAESLTPAVLWLAQPELVFDSRQRLA